MILRPDSNSELGSTAKFILRCCCLRVSLTTFATRLAASHNLPTEREWRAVSGLQALVGVLIAAVDILQADDARLAQVVPTVESMKVKLNVLAVHNKCGCMFSSKGHA